MNKHPDPQAEVEQQPQSSLSSLSPSPLENGDAAFLAPEDDADLDWEIEIIARRHGKSDNGTKTEGSQGCH